MNMTRGHRGTALAGVAVVCSWIAAGCGQSGNQAGRPAVIAEAPQAIPLLEPTPTVAAEYEGRQTAFTTPESDAAKSKDEAAKKGPPGGTAAGKKKPFDPVEVNGTFFEGWPKPKLALVISGRQDGYLEPCGCAGLENQKGGFSRRHTFIKQLEARGWPVAAVDVGGLVRRFGKQAEIQFDISAQALKQMGYSGVGFGPADLRLSAGDTAAAVAGGGPEDCIFVSANVNLFDLTPKARVVKAGGMTLGITSVLGNAFQQQVNNSEVVIKPAAASLKAILPELKKCDVRILLAQTTEKEAAALAKQFPEFNLIVCAEGADEPPAKPKTIEGTKTRLIEVGHKGMFVVVAGFYDDPKPSVRFQRVALDSRFSDSPEMKQLMVTYQDQLQQLGWDGLGLRRTPSPRAQDGDTRSGQFVGGAKCKECHEAAWDVWANSKHAHATQTLVDLKPPRQFDAECISCHAVGWNPQEHFPYLTGFDSVDKTPHLVGNSCENCHGPGAAHVAAEKANPDSPKAAAARERLKISWPQAQTETCIKCHDIDNSPEFSKDVERYWSEIAH